MFGAHVTEKVSNQ